ncbi:MAG: DUF3097 domain-containing protein [Candidatus Nanopelagicales bacterium]
MVTDRYGSDVLSADPHRRPRVPEVPGDPGLVVECAETGWCGAVVGFDKGPDGWAVLLEDRDGRARPFRLAPAAFLLEGRPVTLVRPVAASSPAAPSRTASGSVAVARQRARVARDSRIWVEGRHDAELVERVWGDDLRVEGVVVEELGGVDRLLDRATRFGPGPGRRLGVLVDHLVPGSKEARVAAEARAAFGAGVLVVGHPYVDVWQAVRPSVAGIPAWPSVPPGTPWKEGVCAALGWRADTAAAWRRLLARVDGWTDLEPDLLGRVEELIDFVTSDGEPPG